MWILPIKPLRHMTSHVYHIWMNYAHECGQLIQPVINQSPRRLAGGRFRMSPPTASNPVLNNTISDGSGTSL